MTNINYLLEASKSLYDDITQELSDQSSKKYNHGEWTLAQLDDYRCQGLPKTLSKRYAENKQAWLTKEELVLIMDWKLAKGKFRPTLPKLINSNTKEAVEDITKHGFQIWLDFTNGKHINKEYWTNTSNHKSYIDTVKKVFKKLCELRGVGPATASLILNLLRVNEALTAPFFSDESFLYYVIPNGEKIKYNLKEYTDELLPIYFKFLKLDSTINMNTLERGGWALKMYDLYRITKLANIKLTFEVEECNISQNNAFINIKSDKSNFRNESDDIKSPKRKQRKLK